MVSLQEQLLKAGLVDKKKVKVVNQEKNKQSKIERRTGVTNVNETKEAVAEAQRQQAERARALNAQRDAAAAVKAVEAQIAQMIAVNRQPKGKGSLDIAYNFTLGTTIERIYVSAQVRDHLVAGRLAIVSAGKSFELVPRVIAEKIAERAPERVVRATKAAVAAAAGEDDPYKDFKVPDDFDW
jgi:uncharacterized protein YaiL (DUF2058 family)